MASVNQALADEEALVAGPPVQSDSSETPAPIQPSAPLTAGSTEADKSGELSDDPGAPDPEKFAGILPAAAAVTTQPVGNRATAVTEPIVLTPAVDPDPAPKVRPGRLSRLVRPAVPSRSVAIVLADCDTRVAGTAAYLMLTRSPSHHLLC